MNLLSEEFLEITANEFMRKVDRTLKNIEKNYAIRAKYLSKTHAAKYADCDVNTLNKWISRGLPVSKIEGCFRISAADIDEFMDKHKI